MTAGHCALLAALFAFVACSDAGPARAAPVAPETVSFASGDLTLRGVLYRPAGASAGPFIGDQIAAAEKTGGRAAASAEMVRLLETDHLADQLAALAWLRAAPFVDARRIAAAGNSFGGIETVLGVAAADYCAGIDAAGGAQSWAQSPELQASMLRAVRGARAPIFFFQAANDFDTTPTRELAAAAGGAAESRIYPAWGTSARDGHAFAYRGSEIWFADALRFLERSCR